MYLKFSAAKKKGPEPRFRAFVHRVPLQNPVRPPAESACSRATPAELRRQVVDRVVEQRFRIVRVVGAERTRRLRAQQIEAARGRIGYERQIHQVRRAACVGHVVATSFISHNWSDLA